MAKEKFNWKGLFIKDEGGSEQETPTKSTTSNASFPEEKEIVTTKFPEKAISPSEIDNSVLGKIVEMYEAGFESLNQPGYDFYEFFKAIKAVGSNDATVYKMALTMAKSVDSKVTKASLLKQSDFYVKEINKVHQQYRTKGSSKKSQIQDGLKVKKGTLANEISKLEQQIIELQTMVGDKKNQLQSIDSNLITDVAEIEQKIVANDLAKMKILETITNVVDGIKNNL